MTTTPTLDADRILPTILVAQAQARSVDRLSPSFVRVELGAPEFVDLARDEGFDTRLKLIFPGPTGVLPALPEDPEQWYAGWLAMPDAERPPMRTYTIREITGAGPHTGLVVDFVVHEGGDLGPACRWALSAAPGDESQVIAPYGPGIAAGNPYQGTEFQPGDASYVLLVGDETALPAIARIVADLPRDARGAAYLEVPTAEDELPLTPPEGLAVRWISRADRPHGEALQRAVRRHVALPPLDASPAPSASEPACSMDVEIWETPTFSAYGESLEEATVPHTDHQGMYAWVAGESSIVKVVRRALVGELGLDRRQVAFMGYWRQGVAMRS